MYFPLMRKCIPPLDFCSVSVTLVASSSHTFQFIELQESINKESSRYLRHSLRSANPSSAPTPNSSGVGSSSGSFTVKDEQIPDRVQHDYDELEKLANEKIRLTEKLNSLIARTRARLDHDLKKVLILQGDLDPNHPPPTLSAAPTLAAGLNSVAGLGGSHSGIGVGAVSSGAGGGSSGVGGVGSGVGTGAGGYAGAGHGSMRNPVQMMNESLRSVMAGVDALAVPAQQQHQQQVASAIPGATATNKRTSSSNMHASSVMYSTDSICICGINRCQENRINGHDPFHQTPQPSTCDYQRTPATRTFRSFCNSAPPLSRPSLASAATSTTETSNSCAHGCRWRGRRC